MTLRSWRLPLAAGLLLLLALPPVADGLQSRMQLQLLVQLPLLCAAGYLLRGALPDRLQRALAAWNPLGINGLILASFVLAFWMLPRSMDASASSWAMAAAKWLALPLLAGLPLGLSWPRMNFVVRGLVCMELIASCVRLGLLYAASPARLCNRYLISDQQSTGQWLLMIGAALFLWLALQLFVGHVRIPAEASALEPGARP